MFDSRALITGAAFLASGLNGITFAFLGTSLPAMRAFMEIDFGQAGLFMAMMQAGLAVAALIGGLLSDIVRIEKVMMLGCLFLGGGSFFLGIGANFYTNLGMMALIGVGVGFAVSSSNALLVGMYQKRKGMILNVHHVFFGIGSLVGPLIMGSILVRDLRWQNAYSGLSLVMFGLFLVFSLVRLPASEQRGSSFSGNQVMALLADRFFLLITIIGALAIGTQFSVMLLAVSFLSEAKSISIANASIVLSLFFVGLVIGRLVCSRLSLYLCNSKILLFLTLFQAFMLLLVWLGDSRTSMVSVAFCGLACSGLYPCFLALTGTLYYRVSGTALGILTTTAGLGGIIICWLTGIVSEEANVQLGFIVPVLCSMIAFLVYTTIYRPLCSEERGLQAVFTAS